MFREPKAMREIHKIRRQMSKEFRGLPMEEIIKRINAGGKEELKRINQLRERSICEGKDHRSNE